MRWVERLLEANELSWRPVRTPAFAVSSLLVAAVCLLANTGERWVFILDSANLVFHEAGHPLSGLLFGERAAVYGGSLGQLVFPLIAALSFWWRREALSFALCMAWAGENFWNIGRYMADARAQMLPLVGGGEHDWTEIFSRWHALPRDTAIAGVVCTLAWIVVLAAWGWLARRWWFDRRAAIENIERAH